MTDLAVLSAAVLEARPNRCWLVGVTRRYLWPVTTETVERVRVVYARMLDRPSDIIELLLRYPIRGSQ